MLGYGVEDCQWYYVENQELPSRLEKGRRDETRPISFLPLDHHCLPNLILRFNSLLSCLFSAFVLGQRG